MSENVLMSTTNPLAGSHSYFDENYQGHSLLGRGGFGRVFEATERNSGLKVAIKRVKLKVEADEKPLEELKIHSTLDHENIVRYYNSWTEPAGYHEEHNKKLFVTLGIAKSSLSKTNTNSNSKSSDETEEKQKEVSKPNKYLFIVTSLCKKESLAHRLSPEYRSNNEINRIEALRIFQQTMNGLAYLHGDMHTIHCDLKPDNILFSIENDIVKIADFGFALMRKDWMPIKDDSDLNGNNQVGGTYFYKPLIEEPVSFKTDMYASGIILFELLYAFSAGSERIKVLGNIRKANIEFPGDFKEKYGNKILKVLIRRLVSHIPSERPTANDLNSNISNHIGLSDYINLKGQELQKKFKTKEDAPISTNEGVLNSSAGKPFHLAINDIQYGGYRTSNLYEPLSSGLTPKFKCLDCKLIDEHTPLNDAQQSYHNFFIIPISMNALDPIASQRQKIICFYLLNEQNYS